MTGRRLLPFARARKAVPAAAILLAATLFVVSFCVLTGCGSDGSEDTPTTTSAGPDGPSTTAGSGEIPAKIAIIAPEKANDFGWNQQGVESAQAIAAEIGAELEIADGAGYGDIAPVYRQLVDGGAEWVILWASGYNTVGPQLAEETGTKTVVIGAFENGLAPGLSADFETDAQDGAYLAGMVAALMSKIGNHRHRGLRR